MSSKYDDDDDEGKNESKYEHKSESPRRVDPDKLIDDVQNFFYTDEKFSKLFENFVDENCDVIDLESDEYALEYTEVYNRYKALFEEKMEDYINSIGSNIHEFYNALRAKTEEDKESASALFGQILLSVMDFDIFMIMMRETARNHQSRRK